ncbi:hypothetical protein JYU07_00355 [Roseiflexus sp. AH-315-K22]|nr:hypothetical protein [Roseiflexus sp. AH-315-K22]
MLLLNPRRVRFAGTLFEDVTAVIVDRQATREVVEWSDLGPHVVLADVAEQRVEIRVVQNVSGVRDGESIDAPSPGELGELVFHTSPTAGAGGRKRIAVQVVVLRVEHELSLRRGAVRTVRFVAVSSDGVVDPLAVQASSSSQS